MYNVIKEYQDALNTTPELKVNIAPAFTPPAGVQDPAPAPTPIIPASAFPSAPTQATPLPEQPQIKPPSTLLETPSTPTGETALSYGETVSRLSAQSAQDIQKILSESGQPKPNEVQKQLLSNTNPVQIDPKLTSQNNPFASGSEPRNSAERLAFEPARLANGMLNPFSDANAIAALQAGVPKGEYLSYKLALDKYNKDRSPSLIFNFGLQDKLDTNVVQRYSDSFVGLNAEQIRAKMRLVDNYGQMENAFKRSFLPLLGEDRGSLETLFGLLSLPWNNVVGAGLDVTRPIAALVSGGFNVDEIKKAYAAMRPTNGGESYFVAASLGQDFTTMAPSQSLLDKTPALRETYGKYFNPVGAVFEDTFINRFFAGSLQIGGDPLNAPVLNAFSRFKRSAITPPSIIPEVLSPVRQLPPSDIAGVLPEARTINVQGRTLVTPPNPVQSSRVIVTPENRVRLPETTITQDAVTVQAKVVADNTQVTSPQKRAEPSIAASYESLTKYEPSEVVFPVPRQPFTPSLDVQVKVEPSDIQLYNNVTALFNDSPQLPAIQQAVREVVEQKPITVELPKNPILQEVIEYGRTGELTPNIAVLKGATPDEVRAIVQDKLEVMRDTPFVVPRLEVQPIEVPKLQFDITRQVPNKQSIVESAVAQLPEIPTPQSRSMPDILSRRLESDRISIPESANKAEALQFAEKSVRGEVPRNDNFIADNQSEVIKNIARQSGDSEEAVKLAENYYRAAKKIIDSEDTQIFVNVNQEHLPDVFKNGLKNVYEGTTDEFKSSKQYMRPRSGLEKVVSGIPNNPDIPAYARPTYGYIDSVNQIETQQFPKHANDSGHLTSRGYGDTTIQLKPSAKNRSSFTVGDSLNENGGQTASVPINSFDSASPWASAFYKEGADKARQLPTKISDLVQFRRYLEAQIYGGVNIDDIAALHFRKDPLPEVLAMAFEKDIRVFINGVEVPNVKPVPTSKPVVVTDSAIVTVADLQDAAKGIGTLGEVSQWSVRGDFSTPLKGVLNAVDDLGLDALNTPALSKMVKGGVGKLSNKTVEGVASTLQKPLSSTTPKTVSRYPSDYGGWGDGRPSMPTRDFTKKSTFTKLGWNKDDAKYFSDEFKNLQSEEIKLYRVAQMSDVAQNVDPSKSMGYSYDDVVDIAAEVMSTTDTSRVKTMFDSLDNYRLTERERAVSPTTLILRGENINQALLSEVGNINKKDLPAKMREYGLEYTPYSSSGRDSSDITNRMSLYTAMDRKTASIIPSETAEDIAKSIFNALWRKSTPDQKEIVLGKISATRLEQLGLERVQTKITPPTTPAPLQYVKAELSYHGAAREVNGFDESYYSNKNIYGNGFYVTDNVDVAKSYTTKNKPVGGVGVLYQVHETKNSKFYDLDKSISPEMKSVLYGQANRSDTAAEALQMIDDGEIKSLGEVIDYIRGNAKNNGESADTVMEIIDSFRYRLQEGGYDGFTHVGGVLTKSDVKHQVKIYWKPEDVVSLSKVEQELVDAYNVINDSQVPIEQLRVAMLREQGFDGRTASSMKVHSISDEIARTGKMSDESLAQLIKDRELSVSTPAEQKWSSKMLQQIWEVSTPEQKAYIMKNVDNLEQLGLERIARSNVIDDHLPPEGVFDTPC